MLHGSCPSWNYMYLSNFLLGPFFQLTPEIMQTGHLQVKQAGTRGWLTYMCTQLEIRRATKWFGVQTLIYRFNLQYFRPLISHLCYTTHSSTGSWENIRPWKAPWKHFCQLSAVRPLVLLLACNCMYLFILSSIHLSAGLSVCLAYSLCCTKVSCYFVWQCTHLLLTVSHSYDALMPNLLILFHTAPQCLVNPSSLLFLPWQRKLHQTALAQAMLESSGQLGEASLLG